LLNDHIEQALRSHSHSIKALTPRHSRTHSLVLSLSGLQITISHLDLECGGTGAFGGLLN